MHEAREASCLPRHVTSYHLAACDHMRDRDKVLNTLPCTLSGLPSVAGDAQCWGLTGEELCC